MEYNFTHKQGDTFKAVNFAVTGTPTLPTIATVKMQLRKECGGLVALNLTSVASAGITIVDAVTGLFKINEQIINIPEYNYLYDIQITFVDGIIRTWLSGSFNVECDITR